MFILAAALGTAAHVNADSTHDARHLYNLIFAQRAGAAIDSGSVTVIRRLEAAPRVSTKEIEQEKAAVLEQTRMLQGDEAFRANAEEIGASLDEAARPTVQTLLEEIVFSDDAYRITSWDLGTLAPVDLMKVRPETVRRSTIPSIYGFDGDLAISIPASEGGEAVVLSDLKYRMAPVAELGRAPMKMPSLADLDRAAGAEPLPISLEHQAEDGEPRFLLTIGHKDGDGLVIELLVDPVRNLAIHRSEVRFGGHVLASEHYEDFIPLATGEWYPRRSLRENYDFNVETGERSFRCREEFVVIGTPQVGGAVTNDDLIVPIPSNARIERIFESTPAPAAAPR